MKNIFLGGGGSEKQSLKLDTLFIDKLRQRPLLYLPIAMDGDDKLYEGCRQWFQDAMHAHAVPASRITMWTSVHDKTLDDFLAFGGIYIGGGDTGRLARLLRGSRFQAALGTFFARDGVLYGGSAGAIVLGQTLFGVPEETDVDDPRKYDGLRLIPGYSFRCHFQERDQTAQKIIEQAVVQGAGNLVAIPEASGLAAEQAGLLVVGDEPVTLFTTSGRRIFDVGQILPFPSGLFRS